MIPISVKNHYYLLDRDFRIILYAVLLLFLYTAYSLIADAEAGEAKYKVLLDEAPYIVKLKNEKDNSLGYKLVYLIRVPIHVFWKFKTDFDNDFQTSNRYVLEHQMIRRRGSVIITKNRYSTKPDATFKWQTTVSPDKYRMDYVLLNPKECGQIFHHGTIRLDAFQHHTIVTHVANFDFFGAFFWVNYPFQGGMLSFLKYTARWEQQAVLDWIKQYHKDCGPQE